MGANNVLNQFREDLRKLGRGVVDLADDVYSSNELDKSDAMYLGKTVRMARGPLLTAEERIAEIMKKGQQ